MRGSARSRCRRTAIATIPLLALVLVTGVLGVLAAPAAAPARARPDPGDGAPTVRDHVALAPDASSDRRFAWPVPGRLVVGFDPPPEPWSSGHRGVDLSVVQGQAVRAMGSGVVGFAGVVAGRAWVSVDHPGGVRTTVGPLAVVGVETGRAVRAGRVVGVAAATAHADTTGPGTGLLHVSARVDGAYVDPATLVGSWVPSLVPG